MLGRPVLQRTFVLFLTAAGLCAAGGATAQPSATAPALRSPAAAAGSKAAADDIAMPDDLGAPMAGVPAADPKPFQVGTGKLETLSVNTPIDVIASTPRGKAVLEHELPGLCERPEYVMFRTMSPAKLALLSNGRISQSKLTRLQEHLVQVSVTTSEPPRRNLLAEGGTRVKRFSHSVYRKVLSAIESL